jgi:hypothetical protein
VMAWDLDFQLQACIDGPPNEHIGVVDTQWIVHNKIPSLGSQVSFKFVLFLVTRITLVYVAHTYFTSL